MQSLYQYRRELHLVLSSVLVTVMVRPRAQNGQTGYLAAVLGGAGGVWGLMFLGLHLGIIYVRTFMPSAELEGVIPPFLGVSAGWCIGETLGCWVSLQSQRCWGATQTAKQLALLTPLAQESVCPFSIAFGAQQKLQGVAV